MANVSSSNGLEKRPKLRFPGFDKPWKVFKAEELFQNITDKNHPDETVLTIIQGKGTLPREQAGRNIHYDDASLSNYKKVEQGDFIIHLRSFEGGLEMANEAGIVSPAYTILRCKRPHSSLFYDAYFHTDEFINHNLSKSVEGIRDGRQISYEAFKWLGIPYCEPTEQEKISNLFAALNERIAKQRDLIEALKKYKRGVFEAVFSQKLRLVPTELQKPWKQYKLSDFATRVTRKNGNQTDIPLTISAQYGLIDQRDFFSKMVASTDMSGYYLLQKGEFAYNRSTSNEYPFGSIKRLELYPMGAVSTLYLCFAIKEEVVNSDLAKWYFESSQWYKGINNICAEGARNHGLLNVPTDGFFNTVHTLPSDPNEQLAVVDYLSNIQKKYEAAQRCLQAIENLRSGLLQQLFI